MYNIETTSLLSQHSLRESSATNLNFYALMGKICIGLWFLSFQAYLKIHHIHDDVNMDFCSS